MRTIESMKRTTMIVRLFGVGFIAFILLLVFRPSKAYAGSFVFDPTTIIATASSSFPVTISVSTGTDSVTSVDAVISYSTAGFTVGTVTPGTFFSTVTSDTQTAGKLKIVGNVGTGGTAVTGTGQLATINFTPTTAGSYQFTFDCTTGSTTDSNIVKNDVNATDVVVCSQNNSISLTVSGVSITPTGGITPSVQPSPTAIPNPTVTPTVIVPLGGNLYPVATPTFAAGNGYIQVPKQQLPVTGNTSTVFAIGGLGIACIVVGKLIFR
jgi:hypothetical protein